MITQLLDGNRRFAENVFAKDSQFFADLAQGQRPTVLWIGCSDSRVPVNTITQTPAGEVFVHRNVANIVSTNDWNLSAVLEFSLNHLNIPDIVVCGHYGCGGILALDSPASGDRYIPIWLINAREAKMRVDTKLAGQAVDKESRHRMLVEENVRVQLEHLREYPFVEVALSNKRLKLHGWAYDMTNGHINVIGVA